MTSRFERVILAALLAVTVSACGRDEGADSDAVAEDAAASDPAGVAASAVEPDSAEADDSGDADDAAARPLEVADLDAYVRGVRHEIEQLAPKVEAVKAARAKNDDAAETAALLSMTMSIDDEAARAAGVTPERWRTLRGAIDEVLAKRQMAEAIQPQIDAMEAADTSGYTEEQKAQLAQNVADMKAAWGDAYATLPPEVAAALKAREPELAALRNESFGLRVSVL